MTCPKYSWKRKYATRAEARRQMHRAHERGDIWVHEYACPFCDGFHLTKWPS